MAIRAANVRFRGQSGHRADLSECPLMTQSGHQHVRLRRKARFQLATRTLVSRLNRTCLAAAAPAKIAPVKPPLPA